MKVVITGGGGFLGQVLAKEILLRKSLRSGSSPNTPVTQIILADIAQPPTLLFDLFSLAETSGIQLQFQIGDVSDLNYCKSIVGTPTAEENALSVFHLGAVMSGAPPDVCLRVNLHGTLHMLEATRAWQESPSNDARVRPTFLFSSAGATLGAGHPADWIGHDSTISDATRAAPHTTYGTTKACSELLLADYSRRGFLDGRGVRLPTVVVRAGSPNAATTSCFSSVVREPLGGVDVEIPVGREVFHAVTGYRSAIGGMLAVHEAMPEKVDELLGYDRTVFLPTRSVCLRELEEAMKKLVKSEAVDKLGKVIYKEDEKLSEIVGSFPTKVDSDRALKLGAPETPEIDDLIREYCEDFRGALGDGIELADDAHSAAERASGSTISEPLENVVVALITGGGSGIGRAVAVRLSKGAWGASDGRGNNSNGKAMKVGIVLAGRRSPPLKETEILCREAAKEAGVDIDTLSVPADVTNESDVRHLMDAVTKRYNRLDLLFNNAGINMPPTSVEKIDSEDFTKIIDINLTGCWRMAKAAMQLMSAQKPQGGRIINNGSISAYSPRPGSAPYTASKHAVLGLTKSIALDGRPMNITCGQVDFGNVKSDLTKNMSTGMPQANGTMMPEPTFSVVDAANTVFAMAALPLDANILNMTVMSSSMPFVGRG
ncbi:hypothetical protein ACHAXS_002416 [Conticribra weissflogii]